MHQSFADTLAKWFFDNFPMFDDSFNVLSIHCVVRGLGASFLHKCPAPRGGSLQQHGLLVFIYRNSFSDVCHATVSTFLKYCSFIALTEVKLCQFH